MGWVRHRVRARARVRVRVRFRVRVREGSGQECAAVERGDGSEVCAHHSHGTRVVHLVRVRVRNPN